MLGSVRGLVRLCWPLDGQNGVEAWAGLAGSGRGPTRACVDRWVVEAGFAGRVRRCGGRAGMPVGLATRPCRPLGGHDGLVDGVAGCVNVLVG